MTDLDPEVWREKLQSAADKLAVLGTTEAVGLEMVARGIKAKRRCTTVCVLAEYFNQELDLRETGLTPSVGSDGVGYGTWDIALYDNRRLRLCDNHFVRVPLVQHVTDLAIQFDAGRWPQLERV